MVGIHEFPVEESVVENFVHNTGHFLETVLHSVQCVGLLPVILQQGVDAVTVHPKVEGRALVQELLQLWQAEWEAVRRCSLGSHLPLVETGQAQLLTALWSPRSHTACGLRPPETGSLVSELSGQCLSILPIPTEKGLGRLMRL